jgi:hypothetical protein
MALTRSGNCEQWISRRYSAWHIAWQLLARCCQYVSPAHRDLQDTQNIGWAPLVTLPRSLRRSTARVMQRDNRRCHAC